MRRRAGGIGQRTEQIERGAESQLRAHGRRVLHGRVHGGREQKTDANFTDGTRSFFGRRGNWDAKRIEEVDAAASRGAGYGAIAVFGHADARASRHKRRHCRDVERFRGIAARAAGVEERLAFQAQIQPYAHTPHGAGEAHQLVDRLALHPQSHQKSGDLRGRDATFENLLHGRFSVCSG